MDFTALKKKTEEFGQSIIGLTFDEAAKLAEDKNIWLVKPGDIVTMDLRVDRIFPTIVDGLITEFKIM